MASGTYTKLEYLQSSGTQYINTGIVLDKISLVFFGTPDIGLKSLEYFYNSEKFDVLAVVTQPDKPSGRGQ